MSPTRNASIKSLSIALTVLLSAPMAFATAPPEAGEYEPEIVDFEPSEENKDYEPKTEAEGNEWEFDPGEVELTTGQSDSGTNFEGARILAGNEDVHVEGGPWVGPMEDDLSTHYMNWQGSTLFFGAASHETGNKVDGIAEFYWFESSIPRGSDFYVMQVKVKSSPDIWANYQVADEANFVDEWIFFWNDIQPAQGLDVVMEDGGEHGSLRWDWCVPFDTYEYEPLKTMQLKEMYGAGYSLNGSLNADGKATTQFKEGGVVADLSADADIQSKGYVNSDFKVQSQYTVTLYRWQMLVQSGGEDIHYKLVVLPNEVDEESSKDSAYQEYFIVIQATRGVPVHIENVDISAAFRHVIPLWIDTYEDISVSIGDIWITPPTGVCLRGDVAPPGTCSGQGVCGLTEPQCIDNQWQCPIVDKFEEDEVTCDGLDNDCDGVIDESLETQCETACGVGTQKCQFGDWQVCSAPQPEPEMCGDFLDNDCDGTVDNGCEDLPGPDDGTDSATDTTDESTDTTDDGTTTGDDTTTDGGSDQTDDGHEPSDDGGGTGTGGTTTGDPVVDPGTTGGSTGGIVTGSTDGSGGCSGGTTTPIAWLLALAMLALLRRRERVS